MSNYFYVITIIDNLDSEFEVINSSYNPFYVENEFLEEYDCFSE